jgi:hypothetical protein
MLRPDKTIQEMIQDEYRDRLGQRFVERLDKYYKRIETIEELKEFIEKPIAVYFPAKIRPYCNVKCIIREIKDDGNIVLDQTKEGRTENIDFSYQNMCISFYSMTCFQQIHMFESTERAGSKESKNRLVKLLKHMKQ